MLDYSKHERSPKLNPTKCFSGITQSWSLEAEVWAQVLLQCVMVIDHYARQKKEQFVRLYLCGSRHTPV